MMRKADIIARISAKTGIPKVDVLVTLETFFNEVKTSLMQGEPVHARGFGTFAIKRRAKKIGRNIKEDIRVEIPEHNIPTFKPSIEFADAIRNSKYGLG